MTFELKLKFYKHNYEHWVSEAAPSPLTQSWSWDSQTEVKKNHLGLHLTLFSALFSTYNLKITNLLLPDHPLLILDLFLFFCIFLAFFHIILIVGGSFSGNPLQKASFTSR